MGRHSDQNDFESFSGELPPPDKTRRDQAVQNTTSGRGAANRRESVAQEALRRADAQHGGTRGTRGKK